MNRHLLGATAAVPAYCCLLLGMFCIGIPLQSMQVVGGLWGSEALAIALPAFAVLAFSDVRMPAYLGLRAFPWRKVPAIVLISAANQPVVSFLTWIAHGALPASLIESFDEKQRMLEGIFKGSEWAMLVVVTVAAPLGEELFFRGYLLPSLRRSWGLVAAVLVSACFFSLLHGDPVGFLGLMEIGIVLAAFRIWTGSLWAAVLGHALNNGIAGAAFLMGYEDPNAATPWWALVIGGVFTLAGLVALVRLLRRGWQVEEAPSPPSPGLGAALAALWTLAMAYGIYRLVSTGLLARMFGQQS